MITRQFSPQITICVLLFFSVFIQAESPAQSSFRLTPQWESKYVSEGMNWLEDGGIFSFDGAMEWSGLMAGALLSTGDIESYKEVDIYVGYSVEFGIVETYFGYTRLEYLTDEETDNGFGASLSINNIPYVFPFLEYTYYTESGGGFLELSIYSELALFAERLTLEPYILEGFDFGYITEEYNGPSNLQIGIDVTMALTDQISLVCSVAQSWVNKDVENEDLDDMSWGTLGLSMEF